MNIREQIERYKPFNEQEEKDKNLILRCLKEEKDIFYRSNSLAHMTSSAWVTNKDRTKILMCYHNIYKSWSWLGGHADGEEDLLKVAIREVKEESGIKDVFPLLKDIFSLESLTVDGHIKRGEYVSSHIHLNVSFLLEADDKEELIIKKDENSGVKWFPIDQVIDSSSEEWFKDRIYPKLNEKLKIFIKEEKENKLK